MKNLALIFLALSLGLMGCDKLNKLDRALDSIDSVSKDVGKTSDGIKTTNEAVRKQELLTCVTSMKSDEVRRYIFPVPTGLMVCAKDFAETATSKEVTDFFFATMQQIAEITPLKHFDENGLEVDYTLAEQNEILINNYRDVQMLATIAGFLPEATVDQIIADQIHGGADRPVMLQLLMMRMQFLRVDMVENKYLMDKKLDTVGQGIDAASYMTKIDKILNLPFASELYWKSELKFPENYLGSLVNADFVMDTQTKSDLISGWTLIANAAENFQVSVSSNTKSADLNQQDFNIENQKRNDLIKQAREREAYWKANP